ncbi:MAG: DegT/DnrJ/EryC1/StrS family aminotransferase [Patescibacteria group bacterium]
MKQKVIPHVRLTLGKEEIAAVTRVINSGQIAAGGEGERLERALAQLVHCRQALVVTSGTTALHVGLIGLGVKAGDEVIVPAYACQALLNAVYYVGATPRLVDVDLVTFNIDPAEIKRAISGKTKAIIAPHMFGLMADVGAITKFGVPVLEDCAMAIGAMASGCPAGSWGDAATFSFYATKVITGGEGGALVSNKSKVIQRALDVRDYDKKRPFIIRYNYKLSDLNSAVILAQMAKLQSFIKQRQAVAKRYDQALAGAKFILPVTPRAYNHVFARYVIRTKSAKHLREYLKRNGVIAGHGVVFGLHKLIKTKHRFPKTDEILRTAVSLPIYPALTAVEQQKIIRLLLDYKL